MIYHTMIYKSLITSAILFALYTLWIFQVDEWHAVKGQGPMQDNVIRSQDYIYHADQFETVIVGTSLSSVIPQEALPARTYDLALYGQSVYESMEIVKRNNQLPKTILIESNLLAKGVQGGLVDGLFLPVVSPLKKYVPSLQEKNHPVIYSLQLLRDKKEGTGETTSVTQVQNKPEPVQPATDEIQVAPITDPEVLQAEAAKVAQGFRNFNLPPDPILLKKNTELMKQYIRWFQEKGVRIVMFEVPESTKTCESPLTTGIREASHAIAAEMQVPIFDMPDCSLYETVDGVHLNTASAARFSALLFDRLAQLNAGAQGTAQAN